MIFLLLIPCVADSSWSFVFGFHTWPPGPVSLRASLLYSSIDITTFECILV